jgi:replicative DNA helicase
VGETKVNTEETAISRMFDPSWERLVLGNALVFSHGRSKILSSLDEEDFTAGANRAMFRSMRELADSGAELGPYALMEWLSERDRLTEVGGITGVYSITETMEIIEANIPGAIRQLRRKSVNREAYRLSLKIQNDCALGYTDRLDEIADYQRKLAELSTTVERKNETETDTVWATIQAIGGPDVLLAAPRGVVAFPWSQLNAQTNGGMKRGELTILAARPKVGKSVAALQTACVAAKNGAKARFYSLEMSRESMIKRMLAAECSLDHQAIVNGNLDSALRGRLIAGMNRLAGLTLAIRDDLREFSSIIEDIANSTPDLVVIDYLGLIETKGKFENRNQEISYLSRRLKLCATQHNIPLLVLSQLNRQSDIESRRPRASDLRDSGSLEQDADVILFLHQPSSLKRGGDAPKEAIQILVDRQRNGVSDRCIYCTIQGQFCRIVESARDEE